MREQWDGNLTVIYTVILCLRTDERHHLLIMTILFQ
jgi:hypothetical protein